MRKILVAEDSAAMRGLIVATLEAMDDFTIIEVENGFGSFDRVPFVKEDGIWKIAKEKYAEEMIKQSEEDERRLNEKINEGKEQPGGQTGNQNTQPVEPTGTNTNNQSANLMSFVCSRSSGMISESTSTG